jgi:hypothetical protein
MATAVQTPIPYLSAHSEPFFKLWPHRFDFLYAGHPDPDKSPNWYTERRFPLSDRTIEQGEQLYGVRFGQTTAYVMIDIDQGSAYHPNRHADKICRIRQAMESIGLVESLVCTSSDSGGLHLYFPLDVAQKSYAIGIAVTALMERQGLKVKPGQLEVFPNARPYSRSGFPPLFNGHRLPMQNGSLLLNQNLEPLLWSNQDTFAQHWQRAQQRNQVDQVAIQRLVKTRRQKFAITTSAEKFLNDLNATVQEGWTGNGQTNHILGRIAMRSYIFGEVLYASEPLTGESLVEDIVKIAKQLPGYGEYCNHHHDLETRAREWSRSIEQGKRYFPYGRKELKTMDLEKPTKESNCNLWNKKQSNEARQRIQDAVTDLVKQERLSDQVTTRFNQLTRYKISGTTLYKHRDLWDPRLSLPKTPPENKLGILKSLLSADGCNTIVEKDSSDSVVSQTEGGETNLPSRLLDWAEPKATAEKTGETMRFDNPETINVRQLKIDIQIMEMQLEWSREDLAIYVEMNFAGRRQNQLTVAELCELAKMLQALIAHLEGIP